MTKFPAQFHGFRKTIMGENLITFCVDKLYSETLKDLVVKDIGTEFVVHLEDVTSETNLNEDPEELKSRFVKKMHGLLAEYAEIRQISPEETKEDLKNRLKERKMIENSTKELDIKGLAIACSMVEKLIDEHRTHD